MLVSLFNTIFMTSFNGRLTYAVSIFNFVGVKKDDISDYYIRCIGL